MKRSLALLAVSLLAGALVAQDRNETLRDRVLTLRLEIEARTRAAGPDTTSERYYDVAELVAPLPTSSTANRDLPVSRYVPLAKAWMEPAPAWDLDALLEFVGELHETVLDRSRPLWEYHVIDGIEDRRFAIYLKVHHAYADGVTMARWASRSLSTSADDPTLGGQIQANCVADFATIGLNPFDAETSTATIAKIMEGTPRPLPEPARPPPPACCAPCRSRSPRALSRPTRAAR